MDESRVVRVDTPTVEGLADLARCLEIRREVFVKEQAVPVALEVDGRDTEAEHFLALDDSVAAARPAALGTARLRVLASAAKVERVAVRGAARGRGVGVALMRAVEDRARERGLTEAVLHAQVAVAPFYEKLGYGVRGATFDEAGIPHVPMGKKLE